MKRNSFSFLHTYEATGRYWRGLEKAGLVRKNTGIRFLVSPFGEEERRFNTVAARGSDLYRLVIEHRRPFVVDRLLGGSPYLEHKLEGALIREYEHALGEKFLGFQIHEPINNAANDWTRLLKADPKCTDRGIDPDLLRPIFDWSDNRRCLAYGSLDDYAGRRPPATHDTMWAEVESNIRRHQRRAEGVFTICEGSVAGELAWHELYKLGARCCMAEVGPWASDVSQFMIASLRGAAKAAGQPWGVYFAPWGPCGCTCFIPPEDNAWCVPAGPGAAKDWPIGPELGTSSALQRRLFFHAYLAGAHYLYEEWGAEDNLLDWSSGQLSSYGVATREFLDFQEAHPDIGTPFAPVAILVDSNTTVPVQYQRAAFTGKAGRAYVARDADLAWSRFQLALFGGDRRTGRNDWSGRDEAVCLAPCALPETYEIVPSDAPAQILSSYRKVFPMETCGVDQLFTDFAAAVEEHSPFERATDLTMQINQRAADGAWIVGLYNPRGAWRGDVWNTGSVLNEAFAAREVLRPRFRVGSVRMLYGWPSTTKFSQQGDELHVSVGPGGIAILEILPHT